MGRPLAKRFFGNRNIGTNGGVTSDDGIGGEGIASINWSNYGSWLSSAGGALAPLAGLQLPTPTLPGGVQATWTNYFGASTVTTGAGSVGLVVGETYEYAPIPGLLVTVATSTNNGTNATFTVNAAGSTTALLTDLTGVYLTRKTGGGAATFLVDIKLKIVNTTIDNKGSGYTGAETITVTLANSATGTVPVGTIVLTTDSGVTSNGANAVDNQENAIIAYAYVTANSLIADIQAQKGSRRYRVATSEGATVCKLVATTPAAIGEMSIVATDSTGCTYYVTKLTSRKALLTQFGGGSYEFADGTTVRWTLDAPTLNTTVQLANA